jgi:hypothetical protein
MDVTYRVSAHLSDAHPGPGQRVKIYGVVRPRTADLTAVLYRLVPPCGSPTRAGKTRIRHRHLPDGSSGYGYVFTVLAPATGSRTYYVVTHHPAPGLAPGTSRKVSMRVGSSGLSARSAARC